MTVPAQKAHAADRVAHIGFVSLASADSERSLGIVAVFWQRLRELGYIEGQNLVTESRWAEGQADRLPALMAEIAGRRPDVIVTYGTRPAVAARGATHTIPIVVAAMADPVATGLADSLARPGRNLTGLSMGYADPVPGKWLEILREVFPRLSTVVLIMNPENPAERDLTNKLSKLAAAQRVKLEPMDGRSRDAVDRAFTHAVKRAQAIIVTADPVIGGFHQAHIVSLAQKHRIPTIYAMRNFVDDGGLMAYGPDVPAMFRRAAEYVDKILKGANASELPIEQPTRYSFVLNMKAADAIGLAIPASLELRANEILR